MKIDVVRILAMGTSRSWMCIQLPDKHLQWVFIPRELYQYFKEIGVETAQSYRFKKDK